jgi:hypothetical protein
MMTQSRGIPTDRGRRSREPGSRNEQSGSRLALIHEQTEKAERGRSSKREQREGEAIIALLTIPEDIGVTIPIQRMNIGQNLKITRIQMT